MARCFQGFAALNKSKRWLLLSAVLSCPSVASAATDNRCVPLDFPSDSHFRNVTAPGDIRVLPSDEVILVNKRTPEATRVIFGPATSKYSRVVVVKDCNGTANKFNVSISGEIDAEIVIDGNYATQSLRRVGNRWMLQ
jgi:hypothetical protein